ncbi:hypothetical protein FNF29_04960 [Cafeteria roenbergensis]|uniref:Uncharacterized protein n=1 Tax=Cafeteria roenbergensis TaxID=33653 RepID=A0A5A8CCS7_CAFRO|nr:hypothetical protein FNF29_04960 [Cafeteria roenbergensis]|eukprot:KAA0150846.1 hypothetical protein FNF29_04960 [Cafeteria roenbergensis]
MLILEAIMKAIFGFAQVAASAAVQLHASGNWSDFPLGAVPHRATALDSEHVAAATAGAADLGKLLPHLQKVADMIKIPGGTQALSALVSSSSPPGSYASMNIPPYITTPMQVPIRVLFTIALSKLSSGIGHSMLTVDDGTTPVIVGGFCQERTGTGTSSALEGDAVYTGDAWVLRLGHGLSRHAANDLQVRLQTLAKAYVEAVSEASPKEKLDPASPASQLARRFAAELARAEPRFRGPESGGMRALAANGHVWYRVGADESVQAGGLAPYLTAVRMPPRAFHAAAAFSLVAERPASELAAAKQAQAGHEASLRAQLGENPLHWSELEWPLAPAGPDPHAKEPRMLTRLETIRAQPTPADGVASRVQGLRLRLSGPKFKDQGLEHPPVEPVKQVTTNTSWLPQPPIGSGHDGLWVPLHPDGYIGYKANASSSLVDVIIVHGGYNSGQLLGDTWALYRVQSLADEARVRAE